MPKSSPASGIKSAPVPASKPGPTVTLSARGAARLKSGHPWVYKSDIASANAEPGGVVTVLDGRGKSYGTALYSSSSQIAIRMISREPVRDLPSQVAQRIRAAISYRKAFVHNTNAYRIVFSEADFLPGLVIDRYNDVLSLQILTQAMDAEPVRGAILETLIAELKPEGILERVDPRIRELEQLPARESGLLWGKKNSTIFTMNDAQAHESKDKNLDSAAGVQFHYEGLEGQKTGAFLDQRENYAAAARYAHGNALDIFCYHGGFALHVAAVCSSIVGVDSSRPALEVAEKNASLNHRELDWIEANAFDLLRDYAAAGNRYETIVLDPPAFAKSKRDLDKALSGYKELNLRALKMLQPGGILITCSCSFAVSPQDFQETIAAAARDAHKSLRLLEIRHASQDHPILLNVPETDYLKCLIFHVSN